MRQAMLNKDIIDLDKLTKPEIMSLKKRQNFVCLRCKKPVIFKNGTRKRAHFAHEKEGLSTSNPESAAHLLVKNTMAKWLNKQKIPTEIEKRFAKIDRIADVCFEYQNQLYVLEIQKSPMSDGEFGKRVQDYDSINAKVLWIFLGEVIKKGNLYKLPPVMLGRAVDRLFCYCIKSATFQIFENPVFISTSKIYAEMTKKKLHEYSIKDLLIQKKQTPRFNTDWLEIKRNFRNRGWFYVSKSEKKLLEQCLMRGFNLSLLPTEVGWPVAGNEMARHLFAWQAYILLTLMKHFCLGAKITIPNLSNIIQNEYKIEINQGAQKQIYCYLKWLTLFGIIAECEKHYTFVKMPRLSSNVEQLIKRDQNYVEVVKNLWKV